MSLPKRLITPVWVGQIVVSVVESIRNTGSILHCIGEDLMGVARGADKSGDLLPGDLDDLMALRKSANVAVELLDEQYSALYNCLNAYDKKKKEPKRLAKPNGDRPAPKASRVKRLGHMVTDNITGEQLDLDVYGGSCQQAGYIKAMDEQDKRGRIYMDMVTALKKVLNNMSNHYGDVPAKDAIEIEELIKKADPLFETSQLI